MSIFQSDCSLVLFCFCFDVQLYEFLVYLGSYLLLGIWLANIFSNAVGSLFILLTVSFPVQKLFSDAVLLVYFLLFLPLLLESNPKRHLQD